MADLRERLEAVRLHLQQSDSAVFDSEKSPIILSHVATITAALAHPEKLMGEPHKPSGASIRCPRCGEKQEVVFKYAAPTKEVKP